MMYSLHKYFAGVPESLTLEPWRLSVQESECVCVFASLILYIVAVFDVKKMVINGFVLLTWKLFRFSTHSPDMNKTHGDVTFWFSLTGAPRNLQSNLAQKAVNIFCPKSAICIRFLVHLWHLGTEQKWFIYKYDENLHNKNERNLKNGEKTFKLSQEKLI